jgi:metal-responsive CopG/Arc/MetJ family transcriptional regulator
MKEIKTYLPEELADRLSIEAKEKGIHRSELIRERLSQPPNHYGLTTSDFHKAVTKVRRAATEIGASDHHGTSEQSNSAFNDW